MNENNTDSVTRRFESVGNSRTFNRILNTLDLRDKKVLDLGCSYGEFLVKFGQGSLGVTSTLAEVEYGRSKNIRIIRGNVELINELHIDEQFDAIWANNLFEHLIAPHAFLMKLKSVAREGTLLVLGVPVVPRISSLVRLNKFRGALASAHINFFTRDTLRLAVERAGWKVTYVRPFLFRNAFLDRICSFFAPHLYVVAHNDAGFKYPEKKLDEWKDESYYADLLRIGKRA